jgi:hypothetical protein
MKIRETLTRQLGSRDLKNSGLCSMERECDIFALGQERRWFFFTGCWGTRSPGGSPCRRSLSGRAYLL